jgi:hypothetical protein
VLEALLILAALLAPGYFLGRQTLRKGDGFFERVFLLVAASLAVAGPILTALALLGWFTTPVILICLALFAFGAWVLGRGRAVEIARPVWWDLAGFSLVAGAFALYSRPAEYIVNSRDPGVYAVLSAKLARTGELFTRDPLVGAVSSFHTFLEGKKYPGFYILDDDLIVPQFFPGPFAFLGVGNLAGGLWGELYVVPVMGALSVGFAYGLGRELFGRWGGILGATLLATSYTQIWWSRQPSSEVITQALVLAGLWLAIRFSRRRDPTTGIIAGLLLGAAMLVRVDAFLAAAAIPLLFLLDFLVKRPARRWLLPSVPLAVFAGASLLYLNTLGGRYLYVIYSEHGLKEIIDRWPLLLVAMFAVLVAFLAVRRWRGEWIRSWLEVRGRWLALAGALIVVGVALWAYFVLPVPWDTLPAASRDFDAYKPQILVRMVWFVTPPVAALALVGLLLAAYKIDAGRAILLLAVLSFGFLYTIIPNVAPDLPWATRRFVPAVLPGVALLAGHGVVEIGRFLGRISPNAGAGFTAVLAIVALGYTANLALYLPETREYAGAIEAFERVEEEMPETEVVFMEMPEGFDFTASTFEYVYGRSVLPYDRDLFREDRDALRAAGLLDDALYVTTDGGPPPLISNLNFESVVVEKLELPRLVPVETFFPTKTEKFEMTYRVYRLSDR